MTKYALVGDVGGTNARLALCDIASGEISQPKRIPAWIIPVLRPWCAFISMSIASAWKMVVSP
ncbi:glucokinase [Salmonella enterica subsp. enterica]|uniref:Glucokinase n=1 Tax=Salmonella enterica I TaxID=59201 RepID=A0A379WQG3_SALET|nr:glucokinase [Salmonella enterica subsp. enterica]